MSTAKKTAPKVAKQPPAKAAAEVPRDTLNLRITITERNLIDRAAAAAGKTRTDFILEAARKAAEHELLDRAMMAAGIEAYAKFQRQLDAPAQPNDRLLRTMQAPQPWTAG